MRPSVWYLAASCSAWLEDELPFLTSPARRGSKGSVLIKLDFQGSLSPDQKMCLDSGLSWSDTKQSVCRMGKDLIPGALPKQRMINGPGEIGFHVRLDQVRVEIDGPELVSDHILCDKDETCPLENNTAISVKWQVTSASSRSKNAWEGILSRVLPAKLFSERSSPHLATQVKGRGVWAVFFKTARLIIHGSVKTVKKSNSTMLDKFVVHFPLSKEGRLLGITAFKNICGVHLGSIFPSLTSRATAELTTQVFCDKKDTTIFYHNY